MNSGYQVPLRSFFHKDKPVMLNLVYYSCPMLCNLVLNGQTQVLREMPWTPGEEFEIVTISIDPTEMFNLAVRKKQVYLETTAEPAPGWHFLTDYKGNVKSWRPRWDFTTARTKTAAVRPCRRDMFLTPEGKMSRYLYGIRFKDPRCPPGADRSFRSQARHHASTRCCFIVFTTIRRPRS